MTACLLEGGGYFQHLLQLQRVGSFEK